MNIEKQEADDRLKVIQKKLMYIGLYDAPAMIVIGLALFSKFGHDDPASIHPLLADADIVNGALAIAIPWALFCAYKSIKLSLEADKLKKL